LDKKARELGYRVVVHNDQHLYCRTTTPTGSHLPSNQCMTENQMQGEVTSATSQHFQPPLGNGCNRQGQCSP